MTKKEERIIRAMAMGLTREDIEKWDALVEKTKGENKILDPFKGYIERQ